MIHQAELKSFLDRTPRPTIEDIRAECIATGGVWSAPPDMDATAVLEISLHGVTASEFGAEATIRSWLAAAKNCINAVPA